MAAPAIITAISDALKTVYKDALENQLFEKNILAQTLKKNVGVVSSDGKSKVYTHKYSRSAGVGSINVGGKLPNADVGGMKQSTLNMKATYGSIHLDDFTIEATQNKKAAIISILNSEMEDLKDSMNRLVSRQWYSKGDGVICNAAAAGTTSATLTLKTPTAGPSATHFLEPGMVVYVEDGTTAAGSGNVRTISSVDSDTQVTLTATASWASGDEVSLAQYDGSTYQTSNNLGSTDVEMMGLQGIVDDGTNVATLQGLARATYPWFKAYVSSNSGTNRAVSETLMNQVHRNVEKYGTVKLIITTPELFDSYGEKLTSNRRYTDTVDLKSGFTALKFKNSYLVADWDCPANHMFFLDTDALSIEEMTGISWMDRNGDVLYRAEDNTASYKGTLRYYANLGALTPRKTGVLKDVV